MKHLFLILFVFLSVSASAKVVRYELSVTRENVNVSGKKTVDFALLVNKSLPAPTLEFIEGDEAEIVLTNDSKEDEISVHWHGLLLDPYMDGVPYVNTPPIHPGKSFTFRFKLRQSGTYWYHSHTNVQEQKGVYGAIVIHPKIEKYKVDKELVLILSDWIDENATQVLANLRKDGDYYTFKKGTMRSYLGALSAGSLKNFLTNEWTRMGGMDLSDVGYDAFLINGKKSHQALEARSGEKIRIRIINAGASSYFHLSLAGLPMQVISADGIDIKPSQAKEILIGMAETYDVLFTVPENRNYEFKATAQDGTGSVSAWIGSGEKFSAPEKPMPDLYATMDHGSMNHGSMNHGSMNHGSMNHGPETIPMITVDELEAASETTLPEGKPKYDVTLNLDGDMERYV